MKPLKFLYVYILECSDKTYYTGVTNNPERRLEEHNSGSNKGSYTSSRLPVRMIYCERFTDFDLAIKWEKRIKDWSRKKKEALIKENWDQLKIAAECKNESSHKIKANTPAHVLDFARTDSPQEPE
ncbi:MAG: Excinuclease subunit [Bacteroidetes bacterium]|jgi:putative endonuclease|nr:Excinuclease subunit [Bacteroidota bacterium]